MKKMKIMAGLFLVGGMMWAFCPWLVEEQPVDKNCACEVCLDGCEHMNGDVCDCHDNDCGCPACVDNG